MQPEGNHYFSINLTEPGATGEAVVCNKMLEKKHSICGGDAAHILAGSLDVGPPLIMWKKVVCP